MNKGDFAKRSQYYSLENILTRLKLPHDARAQDLFKRLNQRYFQFADCLPPTLSKLARQRSSFLGGPDQEPFEGVPGLNPVLASTPWLFWETFSNIDDEIFLDIAEAGMSFVLASIVLDHLVDGQAIPQEEMALFHQALYGHGIAKYREVMPSSSPFWIHFDRLAQDHLAGLAAELESQSGHLLIKLDDLFTMAHGKVSPIVTTIAALAFTSGQPEVLSPIEISLKHIAVASQLLDDVGDWEHDLKEGHYTYFLSLLAAYETWGGENPPAAEELRAKIEEEWNDIEHLRLVLDWLDDSVEAVKELKCPAWLEYVEGYRALTDENLSTVLGHHLIHKLHPLINSPSTE
jgi:hypothetical protein